MIIVKHLSIIFISIADSKKHTYIISLILIHALWRGIVRGLIVQEALDDIIVPLIQLYSCYPDWLVTAAISLYITSIMNLKKRIPPYQILRAIKVMGFISIAPPRMQPTPSALEAGFMNDIVRQTMGHAPAKHTCETYSAHAAAQFVPR